MLGEGKAVGDLQPVLHHKAKQHTLYHLTALTLLLVVLDYFQDHLRKGERGRKGLVCDREHVCVCVRQLAFSRLMREEREGKQRRHCKRISESTEQKKLP